MLALQIFTLAAALAGGIGGWRLMRSVRAILPGVPRCNDDLVFF